MCVCGSDIVRGSSRTLPLRFAIETRSIGGFAPDNRSSIEFRGNTHTNTQQRSAVSRHLPRPDQQLLDKIGIVRATRDSFAIAEHFEQAAIR